MAKGTKTINQKRISLLLRNEELIRFENYIKSINSTKVDIVEKAIIMFVERFNNIINEK